MARRTSRSMQWALLCGLIALIAAAWARRRGGHGSTTPATGVLPAWPAMEPAATASTTTSTDPPAERYRDAIDGACPEGFPIKANRQSGIYHVPGGRSYERTRAERCYADPRDAEADGYRRARG